MGIKIVALLAGIALLAVGCTQPNPAELDPDYKARSGEKIYKASCITCHGRDGKLCSSGAKDLSVSKMDSLNIVEIIKNGKNGMPRQGDQIYNDEEYSNTVGYVISLRK